MTDRETTHAHGCWGWGSKHYECAVGQIERDEALLRQALVALAYWLEHGETPGSHDIIQRTHDALQERLKWQAAPSASALRPA